MIILSCAFIVLFFIFILIVSDALSEVSHMRFAVQQLTAAVIDATAKAEAERFQQRFRTFLN